MTGVVIVRERCAKTAPPTDSNARVTDIGVAYYVRDHRGAAWFYIEDDHATMPCGPQPRVWFDFPRDTEREKLTTDDLNTVIRWGKPAAEDFYGNLRLQPEKYEAHVKYAANRDACFASFARLRAALDALT